MFVNTRKAWSACAIGVLSTLSAWTAQGQLFVAYSGFYNGQGGVGEYSLSGDTINTKFIYGYDGCSGLRMDGNGNLWVGNSAGFGVWEYTTSGTYLGGLPFGAAVGSPGDLAVDGSGHLFVAYQGGPVGQYTTSGGIVNNYFISGFPPGGLAVVGNSLFVADPIAGAVREYTTAGVLVNPSLIAGLNEPGDLVYDGSGHLFVANRGNGTIGEYNLSGTAVNASLISGLNSLGGLALDGNGNLFVAVSGSGPGGLTDTIAEYTTSGDLANASLITDLPGAGEIVVAPEPSSLALAGLGIGLLCLGLRRTGARQGVAR